MGKSKVKTGICGPWVIAYLAKKKLKEVIDNWTDGYRGFAPMGEVERELKKYGIETTRTRAIFKKEFEAVGGDLILAFIQWGKHKHWIEAQKHTHWVVVEVRRDGDIWIGCSEDGWFPKDSEHGENYLKDGYIRSYLKIRS